MGALRLRRITLTSDQADWKHGRRGTANALLSSRRARHAGGMTSEPIDFAAVLAKITGSNQGPEMAIRLYQSLEVTDGLWELVPVVVAASEAHAQRPAAEVADSLPAARPLAPRRRSRLRELGDAISSITTTAIEHQPVNETALEGITAAGLIADPFGAVARVIDFPAYQAEVLAGLGPADFLAELAGMTPEEGSYLAAYVQAQDRPARTPLLLRAVFAAAVGIVEPLVTRMVQLVLHETAPGSYTSLADPELDKKARVMCYGSPAKWREALVDGLGITILADLVDWADLGLLWEARNVIAHRGGVADPRYHQQAGADIGSILASEPSSVRKAIDQIGATRYAIVAGVWDHLMPGMGADIAESVCVPLWNSLRGGRWMQAHGLARVEEAFAADNVAIATAKVNGWLALDQGRGPGAIRADVEAWDVTALPAPFQVARHLLLRQDGEALRVLGQLVSDGTMHAGQLASWPLFDRIRESGLLDDLLSGQAS